MIYDNNGYLRIKYLTIKILFSMQTSSTYLYDACAHLLTLI